VGTRSVDAARTKVARGSPPLSERRSRVRMPGAAERVRGSLGLPRRLRLGRRLHRAPDDRLDELALAHARRLRAYPLGFRLGGRAPGDPAAARYPTGCIEAEIAIIVSLGLPRCPRLRTAIAFRSAAAPARAAGGPRAARRAATDARSPGGGVGGRVRSPAASFVRPFRWSVVPSPTSASFGGRAPAGPEIPGAHWGAHPRRVRPIRAD
jgi:hypothetical protein